MLVSCVPDWRSFDVVLHGQMVLRCEGGKAGRMHTAPSCCCHECGTGWFSVAVLLSRACVCVCSSVCMRHTPFTRSPFPPCSVWRKRWMLTLGSTSVTPSVSRTARQRAPSSSAGGAGKRERRDGEKEKEKRKGGAWCGWTDGAGDSCPFSRLSSPTSLP